MISMWARLENNKHFFHESHKQTMEGVGLQCQIIYTTYLKYQAY